MKKGTDAKKLCESVQSFKPEITELAESVLFMQAKLEETRSEIRKEPLVISYDNGGGQSGVRENPSFTSYEKMFSAYSKGLNSLITLIKENGGDIQKASSFEERRARLKIAK